MRNKIKITFIDQVFEENESTGVTTCKLSFKINLPPFLESLIRYPELEEDDEMIFYVEASAIVKSPDVFNANGRKVALAKAENKAYNYTDRIMRLFAVEFNKALDQIHCFTNKVDNVIEHNIKYLGKF